MAKRSASPKDERFNSIPQIKRFLEKWTSDPRFQAAVEEDPDRAVRDARIEVDPLEIRALWEVRPAGEEDSDVPEAVRNYRANFQEQIAWRDAVIKASSPEERRFKTWRFRQVARCRVQMYLGNDKSVVHAPVCFELSKGCSVGCWFCGVSAEKLSEHFDYSDDNRELWRGVLSAVRNVAGPAAGQGFAYWATDPLDNPDYEKFCLDYTELLGRFPQTTTAIAMKDPARTRRVLELSRERGCDVNRFSLMSLRLLARVHAEFTAEELHDVELIVQNPESSLVKANAGGFRERAKLKPELLENERKKMERAVRERVAEVDEMAAATIFSPSGSIACVSGFLINMVERSVKLISPCNADDDWPLGYLVFEEGRFQNAVELAELLEHMIATHMTTTLPEERAVRFYPYLAYREVEHGYKVKSDYHEVDFSAEGHGEYMKLIGRMVQRGESTPAQIALAALYAHGVPESDTRKLLNRIQAMGILDEAPPAPRAAKEGVPAPAEQGV